MKKLLLCFMAVAVSVVLSCCHTDHGGRCRIVGVVNGEQYEGRRIFLVPLSGPATAETVDSVEIKDGKFCFVPDSAKIYKILMDYRFRMGLQPLLVVAEPGEVQVVIDSVSHATGMPQNDSLEQWKIRTETHNRQMGMIHKSIADLTKKNDSVQAGSVKQRADSLHVAYKNYTRRMAENLQGTLLGDFLKGLYPKTYKRSLADGRVITIDADTHEEIPE
jgi:hypothetical protein